MHRVADRLRFVRRDAAVVAGQEHRPFRQRHEQRIEHLELDRNVVAIEPHRVDVGFQIAQHPVMRLVLEYRSLEVGRQADVKHVRRLFRRTERLRIGRAQRYQPRREALPHLRVGIGLLQIHARQRRDALQIRQRRHVHDRQTRQLRCGDLDHQHAHAVIGVLRLLHCQANQIVAGDVDVLRRNRVELAGQVAREDRAVHGLVTQLDANFGAVAIDQFGGLAAANQRDVVTRHQQLGRQQRAVRGPKDQNVTRHDLSSTNSARILQCQNFQRSLRPKPEMSAKGPRGRNEAGREGAACSGCEERPRLSQIDS